MAEPSTATTTLAALAPYCHRPGVRDALLGCGGLSEAQRSLLDAPRHRRPLRPGRLLVRLDSTLARRIDHRVDALSNGGEFPYWLLGLPAPHEAVLAVLDDLDAAGPAAKEVFSVLDGLTDPCVPVEHLVERTRGTTAVLAGVDGAIEVFCGLGPGWAGDPDGLLEATVLACVPPAPIPGSTASR